MRTETDGEKPNKRNQQETSSKVQRSSPRRIQNPWRESNREKPEENRAAENYGQIHEKTSKTKGLKQTANRAVEPCGEIHEEKTKVKQHKERNQKRIGQQSVSGVVQEESKTQGEKPKQISQRRET